MASSDSDDGVKVEGPPSTTSESTATREPSVVASSSRPYTLAAQAFDASIDQSSVPATDRDVQQPLEPLATEPASSTAALSHTQFETTATSPGRTAYNQSTLPVTESSIATDGGLSLREVVANMQHRVQSVDQNLSRLYGTNYASSSTIAALASHASRNEEIIPRTTASHHTTPAGSNRRDRSASPASRRQHYRSRTSPQATGTRRRHACQHCGRRHAGECWTCSRCNARGHTANTCTYSGQATAPSALAAPPPADDRLMAFVMTNLESSFFLATGVPRLFTNVRHDATSVTMTIPNDQLTAFLRAHELTLRAVSEAGRNLFGPRDPAAHE